MDYNRFIFYLLCDEWLQRISGKFRSIRGKLTAAKLAKRNRTVVGCVWDASHISPFKLNKSEQNQLRSGGRTSIGNTCVVEIGYQSRCLSCCPDDGYKIQSKLFWLKFTLSNRVTALQIG